jgi:hypothetical protein
MRLAVAGGAAGLSAATRARRMAAALGIQILGNLPSVTARNNAKTAPFGRGS